MIKKAAMFGLDARIALAIFGALSVISGASLYSAIQKSKVIATIADLREVSKAVEQYMLDTGQNVVEYAGTLKNLYAMVENVSSIEGWNGPYLSYEKDSNGYDLVYTNVKDGNLQMHMRSINDAWGGEEGVDATLPADCTGAAEPCGYWITLGGLSVDMMEAVDTYIDGSVDYRNGKIRIFKKTSGYHYIYYNDVPEL